MIKIDYPSNGATLPRGIIGVKSTSTDNIGVVRVELYVDGKYINNSSVTPFTINWNATGVAVGQHTLILKAKDAAGNTGISSAVNIILN